MRKIIKRILEILDGTPAVYGKKEKGQSLVEMTTVTPLIIILIVGIVEIGWFANNYLILLEVTRVGARRGALLTGDFRPDRWDNRGSIAWDRMDLDPNQPNYTPEEENAVVQFRQNVRNCDLVRQDVRFQGFYSLVACQMIQSLDPIRLRVQVDDEEDKTDDIIISVFAIKNIYNAPIAEGGDYDFQDNYNPQVPIDEYEPGFIPVVVGRWPTNANECTVWRSLNNPNQIYVGSNFERDPFDYINNAGPSGGTNLDEDWIQVYDPSGTFVGEYWLELGDETPEGWRTRGYDDPNEEYFRGFTWTGYRRVEVTDRHRARLGVAAGEPLVVNDGGTLVPVEPYCYGSDWTVYDVQELMYGRGFRMTEAEIDEMRNDPRSDDYFGRECPEVGEGQPPPPSEQCEEVDIAKFHADQGLVLVEIYWRHRLLLDLPVFSPVFNVFGTDTTIIYVWSAFPMPAMVPNIRYNMTHEDFSGN
jgi:hypothetical protein